MTFNEDVKLFSEKYRLWCSIVKPSYHFIKGVKNLTIARGVEEIDFWFDGIVANKGTQTEVYRLFYSVVSVLSWYSNTVRHVPFCLDDVLDLLIAKNHDYGNSALMVPSLLPTLTPSEAILVRLSDKRARLNNLVNGAPDTVGESIDDTLKDIIGYLVLYWIAIQKEVWE